MTGHALCQRGNSSGKAAHPTVEEVLEELNGSTVLSKLDLRWDFHDIELHEDSRNITIFITYEGLFRYKRLIFGVNAAPEKYQHVIRQAIPGVEGAINIADDLIVHGKTDAEHDQNLHKLFTKLQEKNLTLRCEKCTLRMRSHGRESSSSERGKLPYNIVGS